MAELVVEEGKMEKMVEGNNIGGVNQKPWSFDTIINNEDYIFINVEKASFVAKKMLCNKALLICLVL